MKLTTKSEYALICLKFICEHSTGQPISVSQVAEAENLPKDYVEQIFVKLRRAGIIKSIKGIYGGFTLAKSAQEITVKQVIDALEGDTFEVFCSPRLRQRIVCGHYSSCSIRPFWMKLKNLIDEFCQSVTLSALTEDESAIEKRFQQLSVLNGIVK